jgi:hypothetical protein
MMNTTIAMSFVIPAQARIQRIYSKGSWVLSRVASLVQLTGFPLSRE